MFKRVAFAAGLMAAIASHASAAEADAPRRVVSFNLCADQLLLALADPGQIVALSRFSRDPGMSAAARKARSFPVASGGIEWMSSSSAMPHRSRIRASVSPSAR